MEWVLRQTLGFVLALNYLNKVFMSFKPILQALLAFFIFDLKRSNKLYFKLEVDIKNYSLKGGDPAPPSDSATLLRLHPSHWFYLRRLPPCG